MSDYLLALSTGFGNVFSWPNIFIPILGTLIAMVTAFLPGVGGTSLAALLLILTLNWEPVQVLLLFGALTGGATYMGSITAILFNIPGNASSAAVLLDGHPMSRNGLPKTAIAAAATASAIGSLFGVIVLICVLPIIRPFILQFGPLERLLLGVWGLTTIIALPNRSSSKALAATLLGLLLAMVGSDPTSGIPRWTFGSLALYDGFHTVTVLLGFFTLSEVMSWRSKISLLGSNTAQKSKDSTWAGVRAVFTHFGVTFRSSILGTLVGIIPGVGGTVSSFIAYGQTVQSAKGDKSQFGKGDIRGVIAPEAAVDAKDGGSLLPLLAFGLPGSEGGVILLSVLMIHGFVPGLPMLSTELSFSFTLIVALLFSNILTSAVGLSFAPYLAKLTSLRIDRIVLPVLIVSLITVVQLNGAIEDVYVAVAFGILGYLFGLLEWPRIPFVIAFVLGGFIEDNFALSLELQKVGRLDALNHPAALTIAALIAVSMIWMVRKMGEGASKQSSGPNVQIGISVLFATSIAAISGIFLFVALTASSNFTLYPIAVAGASFVVSSGVTLELWLTRDTNQPRAPYLGLPQTQRIPLLLMTLLAPATFLFGLPVATGVFAGIWFCRWEVLSRKDIISSLLVTIVTFAVALFYTEKLASVILPEPAVLWLF
jgi:putative tricarboxylic transport membrane protein